jgi:dihydrofolate synthase/folylpolyglutamate synthase
MSLEARIRALQERARRGMELGLDPTRRALADLGDPHLGLQCVHVAGSNGKGSVSAMVESILRDAGLSTGLYTSPHLCRFSERIRLGGEPIDDPTFERSLAAVIEGCRPELTFFESLTVAAFHAFREARVDVAVLEVGLGGRLDATNVLPAPLCTAVTSIALEHTQWLGATLDRIAREKAGIFKPRAPVVLGPLPGEAAAAVEDVAAAIGAGPTWRVARGAAGAEDEVLVTERDGQVEIRSAGPDRARVRVELGLRGPHQAENAAVAAGVAWRVAETWPAVADHIAPGLARARWPGRFERIDRGGVQVILDCAHNPHGAAALAAALAAAGIDPARTTLVFGALSDKSWREMLERLSPLARRRIYTAPKGRPAADLAALAEAAPGEGMADPARAVDLAIAGARAGDTVVVTGSIYLVGEVRGALLGIECDPFIAL